MDVNFGKIYAYSVGAPPGVSNAAIQNRFATALVCTCFEFRCNSCVSELKLADVIQCGSLDELLIINSSFV